MKIYENLKNETIDPGEGVRRLLIRLLLHPEGIFSHAGEIVKWNLQNAKKVVLKVNLFGLCENAWFP